MLQLYPELVNSALSEVTLLDSGFRRNGDIPQAVGGWRWVWNEGQRLHFPGLPGFADPG